MDLVDVWMQLSIVILLLSLSLASINWLPLYGFFWTSNDYQRLAAAMFARASHACGLKMVTAFIY